MDKSLFKYFCQLCEIYIVLNSFVISMYINKIYIKFYTYVHKIEIKGTENYSSITTGRVIFLL